MGVYTRGRKLWIRFRDADGNWRDASTGYDVGQEELAQTTYDEIVSRVAARAKTPKHAPSASVITVRTFAAGWLVKRRERDLDWRNDESRLKHHILPEIGDLPVAEVRARHLVDMFHKLRTDKERGLAQRTIYNVYSVVSALFRDAKLADLIEQSPCVLDERQLGPLVDKDSEWRNEAVFTREEAETMISDARIPPDRQVVYGLELLAGVRPGEGRGERSGHGRCSRCRGPRRGKGCARIVLWWPRSRRVRDDRGYAQRPYLTRPRSPTSSRAFASCVSRHSDPRATATSSRHRSPRTRSARSSSSTASSYRKPTGGSSFTSERRAQGPTTG